jgi:ATP synthase protein I
MDLEELKNHLKKIQKDKVSEDKDNANNPSILGMAMKMGTELVAAVFVATFIGFYIDKWLETKPIFIIVFFIIGSVAGILNIVRSSKMINKE